MEDDEGRLVCCASEDVVTTRLCRAVGCGSHGNHGHAHHMASRQDPSWKDVVRRPPRFYFVAGSSPPIPESGCGVAGTLVVSIVDRRPAHGLAVSGDLPSGQSLCYDCLLASVGLLSCRGMGSLVSRTVIPHPPHRKEAHGRAGGRRRTKERAQVRWFLFLVGEDWHTYLQRRSDSHPGAHLTCSGLESHFSAHSQVESYQWRHLAHARQKLSPTPKGFRPTRRCVFFSHVVSENAEGEFFRIGNS
jgi:hypothetical protein